MLYRLFVNIAGDIALFKYITFRAAMAAVSALLFSFLFGKPLINLIGKMNFTETIREDGPKSHQLKSGTPTMGGLIIITSILTGVVLWSDLSNDFIRMLMLVTVLFGILGFTDDIMKRRNKKGVVPRYKLIVQFAIGLLTAIFVLNTSHYGDLATMTNVLFLKNIMVNLSILFMPFVILVIMGTSNAVNIADGLDGLAIGMLAIVFSVFTIITYITGHAVFSSYLNMMYISQSGEISVFMAASAAACLGFLWFNAHPAQIFMGDTGALTLGGILGVAAVMVKQEILLLIAGGMFAIEVLSVIIQVSYFRISKGKRIFRMAPLHHHYEQLGIPENKIVARFWIMSILFGILALSTLKLR